MNQEKLDALASRAGFDVERLRAPYPGGFPREDMLALESFAELIIKECADLYDKSADNWFGPTTKDILKQYSIQLKKYFGVEE